MYQLHWEKLKEEQDALKAEKKVLQCQLVEALSKAKTEATVRVERTAQAREQGCQPGCADTLEYLHEVLVMLAQEFLVDNYFKVNLHYVDVRQRVEAEGRDPEEVEFISPSDEGDGLGDEATDPGDADAKTPEDEGRENSGEPNM